MRHMIWPFLAGTRLRGKLAVFLALAPMAFVSGAPASTRPKIGGTLRVQISERMTTIDPRQWPGDSITAGVAELVDSLVFDRLTRLDEDSRIPASRFRGSTTHRRNAGNSVCAKA